MFLQAVSPTPVLNRPDFDNVYGKTLLRDNVGIRALEFVALTGTLFKVKEVLQNSAICRVETEEYPSSQPLYVDKRFCKETASREVRQIQVPSKEAILKTMHGMLGLPYVWGGNVHKGVPAMEKYYPLPEGLPVADRELWMLRGVDCTGLLYDATAGFTPRNSSDLLNFGKGVNLEGESVDDWIKVLHPLDLIVWKGHLVVVYDSERTIESRHPAGVLFTPIQDRFKEILDKKQQFVIRRWI